MKKDMKEIDATVKMYIASYALTRGVHSFNGIISGDRFLVPEIFSAFMIGTEAFASKADAKKQARIIQLEKIKRLENQLEKIKNLNFE